MKTNNTQPEGIQKITLYLGLNDKDTKTQLINTLEAFKIVSNLITNYFDGATIFEADGIYRHEDGTFTIEKTLRIEILFAETAPTLKLIEDLKRIFNQESIAMQKETIFSELI